MQAYGDRWDGEKLTMRQHVRQLMRQFSHHAYERAIAYLALLAL